MSNVYKGKLSMEEDTYVPTWKYGKVDPPRYMVVGHMASLRPSFGWIKIEPLVYC